mmetsp:Transcript_99372/g.296946  ORF Transcript_99372/g.296946 Transcript_99372/m.296946 type:complete len:278 (+) Transcript_99372:2-835(+)
MCRAHIEPNLITYSTVVKGHCQSGNIQEAFAVLQKMRRETSLKPDEVMYNSMLDGCAQQCLIDEGLQLLEQMQAEGVRPSNFTLSVLVKLFSRSRKLDRAFSAVRELAAKYRLRPNVHVHTNLIQACVNARQSGRAVGCFEQMVQEGVQPNERTYAILLRGLLAAGQHDTVAGLIRTALSLEGGLPALARHRSTAACSLDGSIVNQTIAGLAEGCQTQLASELLTQIRECRPKIRITAATQSKVVSGGSGGGAAAAASPRFQPRPPRVGKGGGRSRA